MGVMQHFTHWNGTVETLCPEFPVRIHVQLRSSKPGNFVILVRLSFLFLFFLNDALNPLKQPIQTNRGRCNTDIDFLQHGSVDKNIKFSFFSTVMTSHCIPPWEVIHLSLVCSFVPPSLLKESVPPSFLSYILTFPFPFLFTALLLFCPIFRTTSNCSCVFWQRKKLHWSPLFASSRLFCCCLYQLLNLCLCHLCVRMPGNHLENLESPIEPKWSNNWSDSHPGHLVRPKWGSKPLSLFLTLPNQKERLSISLSYFCFWSESCGSVGHDWIKQR